MAITDPDCGTCKTFTTPDGKQMSVAHPFPKALTHHYPLPSLDATVIPVYRGNFDHDGDRYRGLVTIDLEPAPRLQAEGIRPLDFGNPPDFMKSGGKVEPARWVDFDTLTIPTQSVPPPAKTTRSPKYPQEGSWTRSVFTHLESIVVGDADDLDFITFFLLNGWYGHDGLNTCYDGHDRPGRVEVVLGDWQLRVEPRGDYLPKEVRDHQRATGATTVTHVGRIRRDNGARFDAQDALEVLDVVVDLVGFALGRVVGTALPVGYRDEKPIWALWQRGRAVDPPLGASSFLDLGRTAAQMAELFRAGYATSKDQLRWQVFENMLGYHYSAEYDATVNMKVLLPVSALQLISYAHLVEELPTTDPSHLTHKQWGDLLTVAQLRNVLTLIGVDLNVPPHLKHLGNVQATLEKDEKPKKFDALGCVVKLRNEVAHPKQKLAHRWTTLEWAETGFAATGMLHLAMLWWLGYD